MTLIFTPWLPSLSPWILSGLLSLLVIAMTLSGGLLSVIRVDILSFLITLILFPALLIIGLLKFNIRSLSSLFPPDQLGFHPIAQWNHPSLPFWFVTSLIVLTVFTYICSPWYGQKIFSAKNEKTAFMAVGITSLLVFCLYGSALLAASFFKLESPSLTDPQRVVPAMIQTWLPPFFRGGAYAILFAAAMTTLAGVWSTMVAMGVSDFRIISKKVSSERWLTLLFALLSWLGANLVIDNILNRLILANIPIAALSFALLAGFHWKKVTPLGAWASVVIGFLWGLGCFIFIGESGGYTWYWALYGIPLIFVTGTIVSLFTNFLKKDRLSL